MRLRTLLARSVRFYWRTNLAVILGVAAAVSVLSGALLVGDSVRGSLRDIALRRLGNAQAVVLSPTFFREQLATDLSSTPVLRRSGHAVAPLVIAQGLVTAQQTGRRVGRVTVYGVDDRFWRFHGSQTRGPSGRSAMVGSVLATELGVEAGAALLVRVSRPSEVPLESLHARKDDLARTMRLTLTAVLPAASLGEFSLQSQQGDVRAVFVPLSTLQEAVEIPERINAILVSHASTPLPDGAGALSKAVQEVAQVEDLGLRVRLLESLNAIAVEASAGLLDDVQATAAASALRAIGVTPRPVLTYLANAIRTGARDVPYSLVTATDLGSILPAGDAVTATEGEPPVVLNEWAARELDARVGTVVSLDYYLWEDPGRLTTHTASFRVAGIVPIAAGDRDLAPSYPGITDSDTLDEWDPPFPIDLRRVRPVDEAYWREHRTIPKAFIPLEAGQRLWKSRYGAVTSLRGQLPAGADPEAARRLVAEALRSSLSSGPGAPAVRDIRAEAVAAARGATDFGQYFVYFSFFLVVSALMLASLFFKLGVEQRGREIGLLRAVGFTPADIRRLLMAEGALLALAGSIVGLCGAVAYGWLMVVGLRTWWVEAVGTTALSLHVTWPSLAAGAAGGLGASILWTWWSLRRLASVSERALLAGEVVAQRRESTAPGGHRGTLFFATAAAAVGMALIVASLTGFAGSTGAFFGAGAALLVASLAFFAFLAGRPPRHHIGGRGATALVRLGWRNITNRPARSVLSVAVIAAATFIVIAVDAFRRGDHVSGAVDGGTGGYELRVEPVVPIVADLTSRAGQDALSLSLPQGAAIEPFRVLPGDDASCLNMYAPSRPRIVGARSPFLHAGRFAFQESLATTDAQRVNPWLLLERREADGAVPVIGDANSLAYVLHRRVGEDIVLENGGRPIRLRVVAALRDSIFQGELVMAESRFVELFPAAQGYGMLLVDAPAGQTNTIEQSIEEALTDFGADVTATAARLAEFHRVENTYLSTFQTLGALGLVLGTVGMGAVLLRNVLERRRELALLGAVGFRRGDFLLMVLAENALLLGAGLVAGTACALLAIAPAAVERGSSAPLTGGAALLMFAVLASGLLSAAFAMRLAVSGSLLQALRSE